MKISLLIKKKGLKRNRMRAMPDLLCSRAVNYTKIALQLEQVIMPKDLDGLDRPILSSSLQLSAWFVSDGGADS